jgi:hypothetical protein
MRSTKKAGFLVAAAVGVAAAGTSMGLAQGRGGATTQQAPPQRTLLQIAQVKPDMIGTFEDLIKNELIPAQKKAGVAYRWTFANGPMGGQGFTFVGVQPITSYAQFDQGPAIQRAMGADWYANYNAKLRATLVSTRSFVQTLRADLSIQSGSPTAPPLAQVQTFQVAPGKGEEFTRIMTSDYLPNYKKAGVKDFWAFAINFGDVPAGQIVTVRSLSKYADLDGPGLLQKAGLSPEAAAQINARRAAVASGVSNTVVRFVPEMSFGSPAPRPSSH